MRICQACNVTSQIFHKTCPRAYCFQIVKLTTRWDVDAFEVPQLVGKWLLTLQSSCYFLLDPVSDFVLPVGDVSAGRAVAVSLALMICLRSHQFL